MNIPITPQDAIFNHPSCSKFENVLQSKKLEILQVFLHFFSIRTFQLLAIGMLKSRILRCNGYITFLRKSTFVVIIVTGFLLSGCSIFAPIKTEPQYTYLLNRLPEPHIQKSNRPITLLVPQPQTNFAYQTRRMAYTTRPYQIAFYANNAWANRPGEMLQPLIVQTLQKTQHFHAILTSISPGRYDFILSTEIQQLVQDYTNYPDLLRFTLRAQIIRATTNQVI